MAEVTLTNANFEQEVLKSEIPVLVDFWATWCGPCKMIAPIIEDVAKEYEGKIKVGKVNVDEETALAVQYGITSIPSLFLFKNGEITERKIGLCTKAEIDKMLG